MKQYAAIDDVIYFWFAGNDTSGSGGDGASPAADVRLAGAAAGAIPTYSPTPTLLTHANYPAGAYEIAITASAANGFAADNTYAVFCTLAIDSQNPTGFVGSFDTKPTLATMTDWENGERLDSLLDAIPTTAMRGTDSAALAATALSTATWTAARAGALTDWINGGRLDAILDIIAADTTTDIPALIGTAQADLDLLTGSDGATLATAQANYAPNTVVPDAAGVAPTAGENANAVWDEILTGTLHNIATSAGRRLREASDAAIIRSEETAQAATASTITLAASASTIDDFYNHSILIITENTGAGQARTIADYVGATRVATLCEDWITTPDSTSKYVLRGHACASVYVLGTDALAQINTECDTALSDYAPNVVVPDAAGVAATPAEVATALTAIHLDHLLAVNYDPASKPGVATALLNELVENDGGISRYTANALEQAPSGGTNPNVLVDTTIATVTDQTHIILTAGSNDDDAYKDQAIVVYDASDSDYPSVRVVAAYAGATKTVTLDSAPDFTMLAGDGARVFVTAPGTTAPTVGQIRVEMEGAGYKLALIEADTDELQGDWTNAGRLDTLLDAIPTTAMRGTDSAALAATALSTAVWTAARAGALTDWLNGGRLDLLLDAIPTTAMRGTNNAALAATALSDAVWTAARAGALTDWINGGRLDLILDIIAADTTTDIPALIGTAQADLDLITGADGVTLATLQALYAPNVVVPDVAGVAATPAEVATALDTYDAVKRSEATADKDAIIVEVDANETKIDSLQTDSTAIKAKTDNLPSGIPKNVALPDFTTFMVLTSDHVTAATGKTLTGTISKDGAAFSALTNAIAEVSSGLYTVDLTQAEMNADVITLIFNETDCDQRVITIYTT